MSQSIQLRWAMRAILLSLPLVGFAASASSQDMAPPLECPQCGEWSVSGTQPSGAAGERIFVSPETVLFPACGRFRVSTTKQTMSEDSDQYGNYRRYRSTLDLQPLSLGSLCTVAGESTLRLEVDARVGHRAEGGFASFAVYRPAEPNPILVAEAWNFERDNPCESGAGRGAVACMEIANAGRYKVLAATTYAAHASVPRQASLRLAKQFNAASFAASTLEFCIKREADNGGGHWPYFWALGCQAERLASKLDELQGWRACIQKRQPQCKLPTNRFDRSRRKEQ